MSHVTMIVINSGFQMSEMSTISHKLTTYAMWDLMSQWSQVSIIVNCCQGIELSRTAKKNLEWKFNLKKSILHWNSFLCKSRMPSNTLIQNLWHGSYFNLILTVSPNNNNDDIAIWCFLDARYLYLIMRKYRLVMRLTLCIFFGSGSTSRFLRLASTWSKRTSSPPRSSIWSLEDKFVNDVEMSSSIKCSITQP